MIFWIEAVCACVVFTVMILLISHNRQEVFTNDYPPVITEKLRELGRIAQKPPARKKDVIRKLSAMGIFAMLFALLMRYVNGIETFARWLIYDIPGNAGWIIYLVCLIRCLVNRPEYMGDRKERKQLYGHTQRNGKRRDGGDLSELYRWGYFDERLR